MHFFLFYEHGLGFYLKTLEFVTEYYYAFAASCWNASLSTSRPPFDFRLFARAKTLNQGKLTKSYWRATSDPPIVYQHLISLM